MQKKQTELEFLCRQPDAAKKIQGIAASILRKNFRFVRQLEEMENRYKKLVERMTHVQDQLDALKIRLDRDTYCTQCKVVSPNPPKTNEKII